MPDIMNQGHSFSFPTRYEEGQALTANEASALDQLRFENVRNNQASVLRAAAGVTKEDSTEAAAAKVKALDLDAPTGENGDQPSLRQQVEAYAASYQFGQRSARSSEPTDPVEREAHRLAKEQIATALRKKGAKAKDIPAEKMEAMVKNLASRDDIVKEAQRRVKAKSNIGADELNLDELVGEAEAAA
jgi:hypothetical protein